MKHFNGGRNSKPEEDSEESNEETTTIDLDLEGVDLRARPLPPPYRWEPDENKIKHSKSEKRKYSDLDMPSNEPLAVERRWSVVLKFRVEESLGTMTNELADELGTELNISGGQLRRLVKQAEEERSLLRKPGSGAPQMEESTDILEYVRDQAELRKYNFSYKFMGGLVQKEFEKESAATVWRKLKNAGWRDIKRKTRTFLTPDHIAFRLLWCQERMNIQFDQVVGGIYHCDTDEKVFIAMKNGVVLHVPPEVTEVVEEVLSKTQPTRLMVLAVVGPPIPSKNFDGKVSIIPITETKIAERNSKYHVKGDEYDVQTTMDGKLFQKIVTKEVFKDMAAVLPKFIKKVYLQFDSAGGHGNIAKTVEFINKIGSKTTKRRWFQVEAVTQPTRSPETNGLDLGGWTSIDSLVESVSYVPNPTKPRVEMLRDNILDAWERWDGYDVLDRLFKTKTRVVKAIVEHKGRNDFLLPHSKKRRIDSD